LGCKSTDIRSHVKGGISRLEIDPQEVQLAMLEVATMAKEFRDFGSPFEFESEAATVGQGGRRPIAAGATARDCSDASAAE
jgi:hypothetical protein